MILNSIEIRNFRGIEYRSIDFKPGFNLVIGENGKGKTSILEAISVGLGGFIAGVPNVYSRHFSIDEIRTEYQRAGDGSCIKLTHTPVEVFCDATIHGHSVEWTRTRNSVNASRSTIQPRQVVKLAEELVINDGGELPVIVYEAAARVWSQRNETKITNRNKQDRSLGYRDALGEASNIKMLKNWCVKMELAGFKMQKKIAEYEAAKKAVADFMSIMETGERRNNCEIFYDHQLEEIMYFDSYDILPVNQLSAGYQSLIWMVFDIAYRMAVLNPDYGVEITKTSGVILIDEIDMHLHPRWQWNVISALRTVFPNVQFIATTHAPIIIASAKDVNIIDIDNDDYSYRTSMYGLDVNATLENYQKAQSLPIIVDGIVNDFNRSIDNQLLDEAEEHLMALERELGDEHPMVVKCRERLELEKMFTE